MTVRFDRRRVIIWIYLASVLFSGSLLIILPIAQYEQIQQEVLRSRARLWNQLHYGADQKLIHRWYLTKWQNVSAPESALKLWPEEDPGSDRIENQLQFFIEDEAKLMDAPLDDDSSVDVFIQSGYKVIYLPDGFRRWEVSRGQSVFLRDNCPVTKCAVVTDERKKADLVIFRDTSTQKNFMQDSNRKPGQTWMLYLLESPKNTGSLSSFPSHSINWTATYRLDSDLVTPYAKFVLYDPATRALKTPINYAEQKRRPGKVAWFVSNCNAQNGRANYVEQLSKYIPVDIYGRCGNNSCPRGSGKNCQEMLKRDYKFYLAFENSDCRWYITEKFWQNALDSLTLPIVMGAPASDYKALAPYNSFIHVDYFPGPQQLAEYLHYLDRNDTAYNEYFQWVGTGEYINTFFFCRVCAMLHSPRQKSYENIDDWWHGKGTCRS